MLDKVGIDETKAALATIKNMVDTLEKSMYDTRNRSLAIIKLEEAGMWLERDLQVKFAL